MGDNIGIKVVILDDEIDEEDYLELYKLRAECDSKIEYLNNSNNPETINKINEFKKELGLEVPEVNLTQENEDENNKKRFVTLRKFLSDFQTSKFSGLKKDLSLEC